MWSGCGAKRDGVVGQGDALCLAKPRGDPKIDPGTSTRTSTRTRTPFALDQSSEPSRMHRDCHVRDYSAMALCNPEAVVGPSQGCVGGEERGGPPRVPLWSPKFFNRKSSSAPKQNFGCQPQTLERKEGGGGSMGGGPPPPTVVSRSNTSLGPSPQVCQWTHKASECGRTLR